MTAGAHSSLVQAIQSLEEQIDELGQLISTLFPCPGNHYASDPNDPRYQLKIAAGRLGNEFNLTYNEAMIVLTCYKQEILSKDVIDNDSTMKTLTNKIKMKGIYIANIRNVGYSMPYVKQKERLRILLRDLEAYEDYEPGMEV